MDLLDGLGDLTEGVVNFSGSEWLEYHGAGARIFIFLANTILPIIVYH